MVVRIYDMVVGGYDMVVRIYDMVVGGYDMVAGSYDMVVGIYDTVVGIYDTVVGIYDMSHYCWCVFFELGRKAQTNVKVCYALTIIIMLNIIHLQAMLTCIAIYLTSPAMVR